MVHRDKIRLHVSDKPVPVGTRGNNGRVLAHVDHFFEFVFELPHQGVHLQIVNNAEPNLLFFRVDDGKQAVIDNVRLRQAKTIIVDTDVQKVC